MIKKLVSTVLAVCMLLSVFSILPSGSFDAFANTYSGTTGDVNWNLDTISGQMEISGNGEMGFYTHWNGTPYLNRYKYYIKSSVIKEGVTKVGSNAFCDCSNMISTSIPDSATGIGFYSYFCTSISQVVAKNIEYIEVYAFYGCRALKTVNLGNKLSTISNCAFTNSGIENIYLPETLSSVEYLAFKNCNSLKDVYYGGSKEQWDKIKIDGENECLTNATIHYHSTSVPNIIAGQSDFFIYDRTENNENYRRFVLDPKHSDLTGCISSAAVTKGNSYELSYFIRISNTPDMSTVPEVNQAYKNIAISYRADSYLGEPIYKPYGRKQFTSDTNGWVQIKTSFTVEQNAIGGIYFSAGSAVKTANIDIKDLVLKNTTTGQKVVDLFSNKKTSDINDTNIKENIKGKLGSLSIGPYALRGAVINVAGHEIPLIDIEASVKLGFGNLEVISDGETGTIKVLVGFKDKGSAYIGPEGNSTTYWSESYKEVKSLYTGVTGKGVHTTRLWNKFSALRGKLKEMDASMLIDVKCSMAGYLEFKVVGNDLKFSEGGILVSLSASTKLKSYYGPCYIGLGLATNVDGSLVIVNENNRLNPKVNVSPAFEISVFGGIGGCNTYAKVEAYGTLYADIVSGAATPFRAGVEIGARWDSRFLGAEIFKDEKSFASMELYPNFGGAYQRGFSNELTPGMDFTEKDGYYNAINSAKHINRDYLETEKKNQHPKSLQGDNTIIFEKNNVYPLVNQNLVSFDNDTMLLVWIDDNGDKTDENMCSLMYSFYNGSTWSEPVCLFEDGKNNDIPVVYSDGRYAYIVWQKASEEFEAGANLTEMMNCYDLYESTFDSNSKTFTNPMLINTNANNVFEFSPSVYGSNGDFMVSWIQNTDNNVYQMSGTNAIHTAKYASQTSSLISQKVMETSYMITKLQTCNDAVCYSVCNDDVNTLFFHDKSAKTLCNDVLDFNVINEKVFYSDYNGLNQYDISSGSNVVYSGVESLNNFQISARGNKTQIFTLALNADFTKNLYVSTYDASNSTWTPFEKYVVDLNSNSDIKKYSPTILSDGSVFVAFNNLLDNSTNEASLIVSSKMRTTDIAISCVDYNSADLVTETINLNVSVDNKSSLPVDTINISVKDSDGTSIYSGSQVCSIDAFGTKNITVPVETEKCNLNNNINVEIAAIGYNDSNVVDNQRTTSLECIHSFETTIIPETVNGTVCVTKKYTCEYCGEEETELLNDTFYANFYSESQITTKEITYTDGILSESLELDSPQKEGFLFTGWYCDEQCEDPFVCPEVICQNLILYAGWKQIPQIELSRNDKYVGFDETLGKNTGFHLAGAQIRYNISDSKNGLRFVSRVSTDLINQLDLADGKLDNSVSFGHYLKAGMTDSQILDSTTGTKLPAAALLYNGANYKTFSAVIKSIPENHYNTEISTRPYIEYIDANGKTQTYMFTEEVSRNYNGAYHTTIARVAKYIVDNDTAHLESSGQELQDYIRLLATACND